MPPQTPYYTTTPIYYVNDAPHVGHCYTTLLADALARAQRLIQGDRGPGVFFLTGTDEHSERVVEAALERGLTPRQWADKNAEAFRAAFAEMGFSNDDFVRTSEERHKAKVGEYISELKSRGDIVLGEYSGWWDHSQEEYVTESTAREHDFKSPVTGKPLVQRTEENYFFRLSAYSDRLRAHIEANPGFIKPEARRNEVLGRIRAGLQDVPVSRRAKAGDGAGEWSIAMPGDASHRVYVWIDALFNYLSVIDTPERRAIWPPAIHLMAKDILWFHAVIWPCLLMALGKELPGCVYAHSYWIREGRKMSKSLGNFIDMPTLRGYTRAFSRDAVRWFLLTNGPHGATDADFAHAKFVEVYNADLANGLGNASSRVGNMIDRYFGGKAPGAGAVTAHAGRDWPALAADIVARALDAWRGADFTGALRAPLDLVRHVDTYIHETAPFKLAKDESKMGEVGAILSHCAEALRIAALLASPAMPDKCAQMLRRFADDPNDPRPLAERCAWGQIKAGAPIDKGDPLFPRADPKAEPPAPV